MKNKGSQVKVAGQQHQGGGKAGISRKQGGKKKADGRSEKQKRKDRYAAEAGKKFKQKSGNNGAPSTVKASYLPAVHSCRCGWCTSCLLEQDKKAIARREEALSRYYRSNW